MFIFKQSVSLSAFIRQQKTGVVATHPEVSACLVEFDRHAYSDALFTQLSIPFPEILKPAVAKRRADFLSGRFAASQLLACTGYPGTVNVGSDRAPVWPAGWCGSISHTEKWAIAVVAPQYSCTRLGIDIEMLCPEVMRVIATTFTTASERAVLEKLDLPFETALLITFSAKESLFKALYPQAQHIFGFEAARLREIDQPNNHFTLELTSALAPGLPAGYRVTGQYLTNEEMIITLIVN